jgi:hypothetical protein
LEIQIHKKPEYLKSFKLNNINNINAGIDHCTNIHNIIIGTNNSTSLDDNYLDECKNEGNNISFSLHNTLVKLT